MTFAIFDPDARKPLPFRRYLLHKFPYSLIYTIEHDHIHIFAVAHNKRKPGYWRKRIIDSSEK
jgi:hypothetical protein